MQYKKLIIFTDGGARGNPGPAGTGAIAFDENNLKVFECSEFIGNATNNQAEYKAVIAALKKAEDFTVDELDFFLDSELVVKQLKREYRVKDRELAKLFMQIHNLTIGYKKVNFKHVRREMNKEADRLANEAMDRGV
jgi:ribonuclease HI